MTAMQNEVLNMDVYAIGDVEAIQCAEHHRYEMYAAAKWERVRCYDPELVLCGNDVYQFLTFGLTDTLLDVDFLEEGGFSKHYLAIDADDCILCIEDLDALHGDAQPQMFSKDEWNKKFKGVHMRINNIATYANTSTQRLWPD